jgi:hypothetical protein
MRDAVRFFTIVFGLLIGIILIFYYFSDFLSSRLSGEILIIIGYGFILFAFFASRFQKPVLKNKIKIRLKKYNWIYFAGWTFFGLLRIRDGFTDSFDTEILFGFIKEDFAHGLGFILLGFAFLTRTILIDKKGISLNDLFNTRLDFAQLDSLIIKNETIELRADSVEYNYKIQKLTDKEIIEINSKIETLKESTTAQQYV